MAHTWQHFEEQEFGSNTSGASSQVGTDGLTAEQRLAQTQSAYTGFYSARDQALAAAAASGSLNVGIEAPEGSGLPSTWDMALATPDAWDPETGAPDPNNVWNWTDFGSNPGMGPKGQLGPQGGVGLQFEIAYRAPTPIIDSYFATYQASHPLAHNRQLMLDTQRASYQTYLDQKSVIEAANREAYVEHERAWGATQAVAYQTSVSHMQDARARAAEFSLLSQDFQVQTGQRTQRQVTEFARGGVLISGSAEKRMEMTRTRGALGAERLEGQAAEAISRGEQMAETVRREPIEPEYVPRALPAVIQDPDDTTSDLYKARKKLERQFKRLGFSSAGYASGVQKVSRQIGWDYTGAGMQIRASETRGSSADKPTFGDIQTTTMTSNQGQTFSYGESTTGRGALGDLEDWL